MQAGVCMRVPRIFREIRRYASVASTSTAYDGTFRVAYVSSDLLNVLQSASLEAGTQDVKQLLVLLAPAHALSC